MNDGDIVKIDMLVKYCGNHKSKEAWERIKKYLESCQPPTEPVEDHNTTAPDGKVTPWCCPKCGFSNSFGSTIQCFACGYCK